MAAAAPAVSKFPYPTQSPWDLRCAIEDVPGISLATVAVLHKMVRKGRHGVVEISVRQLTAARGKNNRSWTHYCMKQGRRLLGDGLQILKGRPGKTFKYRFDLEKIREKKPGYKPRQMKLPRPFLPPVFQMVQAAFVPAARPAPIGELSTRQGYEWPTPPKFTPEQSARWEKFFGHLRETINPHTFSTWFAPMVPYAVKSDRLVVRVPSRIFVRRLTEHHGNAIQAGLSAAGMAEACLEFLCRDESPPGQFR
jgi:hypothetical protein